MAISRRHVLRGLGAGIALPYLEAMSPTTALAQTPAAAPTRMGFVFVPNGMDMAGWRPGEAGGLGQLPEILRPLSGLESQINVISGLAQRNAAALGDGPGDHARSTATWLTGVHIKKTAGSDIQAGISVDQVAAQTLGSKTRLPSLEIGCERGAIAGDCDSGYSCAYSGNVSWSNPGTPVAKEVNPRAVFERLFGEVGLDPETRKRRLLSRRSVVDAVLEDARSLLRSLGARDQEKLDEYLEAVRSVERRLDTHAAGGSPDGVALPPGVPRDRGEHIRLLGDMMILAFQSDTTRVATFMFANDGSNRPFPEIGIGDGHHDVSHHGKDPDKLGKKRKIDSFHVEQLAYVLKRMAAIPEPGGGNLLANSMIVYGAGISDGDRHNHDDLPTLVAGQAGGRLKTGLHRVYASNTPLTNLFVTMLDKFGVPCESLGDSTGPLKELF